VSSSGQTTIPQCNPLASYQRSKEAIDAAISQTLDHGNYILGEQVSAFEQEFADYHGKGYAVGVANGTDGLELVLRALGVSEGSKVFTVSHTAVATVAAIERAGATPVLVDIDPASYTMCPASLAMAVQEHSAGSNRARQDAVIVVHLYGQAAPHLREIMDLAETAGLRLIEDCSQAHGALYCGQRVGTIGDAAAYSLYPTKNLGALGDGGVCLTRDAKLATHLKSLREYGWKQRYISEEAGVNSRLDELQAAVLRIKLRKLDEDNESRRQIAASYRAGITNQKFVLPDEAPSCRHVYHQFVVQVGARDHIRQKLSERGVGTLVHYPVPIHLQPAYKGRVLVSPSGLMHTENAASQVMSLPMFPELSAALVDTVIEIINGSRF
jgi:dTDP-4-amino-4,6-dideoxygalactose transaminase